MIEASLPVRTKVQPQTIFSWALIGATTLPFIAFATNLAVAVPALMVILMLGGTHVGATTYLFSDPAIRRFCLANPIKMIAIPCALVVAMFAIFSHPGPLFTYAALVFFLIQTWHFGAQNIGVASFISLSDRGRSLSPAEKMAIRAGIWVGMLGVLKAMSPTFAIGASYMPLPAAATVLLGFLYNVGAALAIPLTGLAIWFAGRAWRDGRPLSGLALFLSITFFFPLYLTADYNIGFTSVVTAHGLQYLIFLWTHSMSRDPQPSRRSPFIAPAILALIMLITTLSWNDLKAVRTEDLQSIGIAIIFAITLIHFWIDRYIWRMTDKERAGWIKTRFGPVISPLAG